MDMEMVSVIVPIYNCEKYLDSCLKSIINQTYENIEIILVDDGSVDDSFKIMEDYAYKDSRIKLIKQENAGVSKARNVGIYNSKGDYILFIDSDDIVHPKMIETLIGIIGDNEVAACELTRFVEEDDIIYTNENGESNIIELEDYIELLQSNWGPCCKLYKSELLKIIRFSDNLQIAEDMEMNFQLIIKRHITKAVYIRQILYYYRTNYSSAVFSTYSSKFLHGLLAEEKIYNYLIDMGYCEKIYKLIYNGVLVIFSKYRRMNMKEKLLYVDDFKMVKNLMKKHKRYLLRYDSRREVFNQLKILYFYIILNIIV